MPRCSQKMGGVTSGEKPPELDFSKVFALVGINRGGMYRPVVFLERKGGDLYFGTDSSGGQVPGYRYFLVVYDRQGVMNSEGAVKEVDGQEAAFTLPSYRNQQCAATTAEPPRLEMELPRYNANQGGVK